MIVPDVISEKSLGTSTAQSQLSGDRSGNAADYVVPTWCKSIRLVRTHLSEITPTAGQAVSATLKIQSSDLNIGNYEVFAAPLGGILGATAVALEAPQNAQVYPFQLRTGGGEHLQFYGQAQVANTAAPFLGACAWISNDGPTDRQYFSLATSKYNNASNPTSTGTTAAAVTGLPFTISGQGSIRIKGAYFMATSGTIVASDVMRGWVALTAPELPVPIRWNIEPIQGFLGSTGQTWNLLSKIEGIDIEAKTPTTISNVLTIVTAPANAGVFEVAALYQ